QFNVINFNTKLNKYNVDFNQFNFNHSFNFNFNYSKFNNKLNKFFNLNYSNFNIKPDYICPKLSFCRCSNPTTHRSTKQLEPAAGIRIENLKLKNEKCS
uniref:Pentapeptide repeat-containing protein n=1 Tax=Globodera pallida TaxID=36090 RepID=A0A183CRJ3_GLOPA